jgi:hypothetical protein
VEEDVFMAENKAKTGKTEEKEKSSSSKRKSEKKQDDKEKVRTYLLYKHL